VRPDVRPLLKQTGIAAMKWRWRAMLAATAMLLTCVSGRAATAYVTDEPHSQRLFRSESTRSAPGDPAFGASVETLATSADYTEVSPGRWGHRVGQDELPDHERTGHRAGETAPGGARSQPATTPALAEAAARQRAGALRTSFRTRNRSWPRPVGAGGLCGRGRGASAARRSFSDRGQRGDRDVVGRGAGFWLGYATLARRIRRKFGGLKVY